MLDGGGKWGIDIRVAVMSIEEMIIDWSSLSFLFFRISLATFPTTHLPRFTHCSTKYQLKQQITTQDTVMALNSHDVQKVDSFINREPEVRIVLQPIAPPAALGLAGFAGSTWITASWIAGWWGNETSPTIFFPFVAFWGGLSQFIAGLYGFHARDTLVSVINTM